MRIATGARRTAAVLAATALLAGAPAARGQGAAEFYAGKTISISVGFSTGGGYDLYARALAPYLARHMPGKPSVIVKNVPGAGSLKLVAWLGTVAPRDGTEIGIISRGAPVEELLGGTRINFDPVAAQWIGSMNNEASVCASMTKAGARSVADLKTRELSFGTQGKGSDSELFAYFIKNLLGVKMKVISGYPGTNESILAMERGEVDGNCGWSWSTVKTTRAPWLKDGTLTLLIQMALTRHPELPDLPLLGDLVSSPQDKAQVELVMSRQTMGRPFVAPPGVPADRVAALRKAFMAAMADPELLAFADRSKLEINPVAGEDLQALVVRMVNTPAAVIAATRKNIAN